MILKVRFLCSRFMESILGVKFHLYNIMCTLTVDANSSIWHIQSLRVDMLYYPSIIFKV